MAERVIDVLEMVKIDKEYRHLPTVAPREGNAVFQPIIKECTIGEGRKLIVLGQVRHLLRDGTRLTHVVKDHDHPGKLTAEIIYWRGRILDMQLLAIAAHEYTIGRQDDRAAFLYCLLHLRHNALAGRSVEHLKYFCDVPPDRLQAGPSQQLFSDRIDKAHEPTAIGTKDGIADGCERHPRALVIIEHGDFSCFPCHGIAHCAPEGAAVQIAFEQKILRALGQQCRVPCEVVIVTYDENRHIRYRMHQHPERLKLVLVELA